ncbi:TPA: isochorismatase family protein [Pseudomonas aeruginosa]|uniref:isochorismatase family protein n=1 Tax=Pseudomonas aeruginosa TaxID=287 RepID=UPI0003D1E631|nr:isochorismatase family protein [Pseudomonas aeruginosa]AHB58163.1 hypothetical protein U769_24695 [Pseudomonas aeruginosa MTB-1]EKU6307682.1 isochorismatase family protein [Pseudomonas aeruginosa]EKX2969133.1 isochorismatase family protein [Pseudomonas aeruginosa]MDF5958778.1 isochorismatase family protein [Pseudomonas aeruginosa]MDF5964013.1 isochorismatase family protein [Pseudomonas aeruginosa]
MPSQKLKPEEVALLLIDHQIGTMSWVKSTSFEEMKLNTLLTAKTAKVLKIPTILTSSMEEHAQGPLLPELQEIFPDEFKERIKRMGVIDAMDDENFSAAVRRTGKRKLIVAGVTNDVCTVHPTLTLLRDGYEVHVVADAGGSPTKISDDMALKRMEKEGAVLTSAMQLLSELVGTWASPQGKALAEETAKLRALRR